MVSDRRVTTTPESKTLRRIYVVACASRIAVALLAYILTTYTNLGVVEDAQFYEQVGFEISRAWLSGTLIDTSDFGHGAETAKLLVLLIAVFYYALDGVRALPVLLVLYSAVTALAPLYVYRIARLLKASASAAQAAGWLVALSPVFVFWSGSLYKEGGTLLILAVAVYHTLRLQSRWHARSVAMLLICIGALWGLRYYLAILLLAASALSLGWRRVSSAPSRGPGMSWTRPSLMLIAFVAVMLSLAVNERMDNVLVENDRGLLVELDVRRAGSAREAASGYLPDSRISTPQEALTYFPVGLAYFLAVPLPWQLGSFRQNLIIPENAFWLALYPLVVAGAIRALRRNGPGTMLIVATTLGMCAVYALLSANIGTTYRMRSQVWLLWAPFAALGWEAVRARWHTPRVDMRRMRTRERWR
jgi:hypothetical protein